MMMLTGEHFHTLDGKNRVSFPLRLRESMVAEELAAGFYLTLGFEGSLLLYPLAEWKKIAARVSELPSTHAEARRFQRLFLAKARYITLDNQKRFLLPDSHCKLVGIEKEVVFIGVGTHMELWPRERYESYVESTRADYEELAEKVLPPPAPLEGPATAQGES